MNKQSVKRLKEQGFTLVEIMVAMAISGIVMSGIYTVYYSQQKSYMAQEQVVAMQQNLRAAMFYMEREIRRAGCDPTQDANAGIQNIGWDADENRYTSIRFTLDIHDGVDNDGDGVVDESDEEGNVDGDTDDTDEDITYSLADNDGDGDSDLERNGDLIAENIDALDFVYLDDASPPSVTANIDEIRSVQITLVARTGRAVPGYTDTASYTNQQGTEILAAQNDNFRRRCSTTSIRCRNLGL